VEAFGILIKFKMVDVAAKFILPIPIVLDYLIPLDVDVTGNITAKICEVWSEFNIFLHLNYRGNGRHFEFCYSRLLAEQKLMIGTTSTSSGTR
jgi:hypothetical protein